MSDEVVPTTDGAQDLGTAAKQWGAVRGKKIYRDGVEVDPAAYDPAGAAATVAGNLSTHAGLTTTAHGGIVASTDSRLTDARTPTAHAASHQGGSDALTVDAVAGTGSLRTLGTAATAACAGNDSRLSDSRTPTAHVLDGAVHTVSGLTTGYVLQALTASTFGFAAPAVSAIVPMSNCFYVAKNGNDSTGNGSQATPFLTVQKALDSMTGTRNAIVVAPGAYSGNLTFAYDGLLLVDLRGASIVGDVAWSYNPASSYQTKLIFEGHDLRSGYPGYLSDVIDGNVTCTHLGGPATDRYEGLHLINCGVRGNITFAAPNMVSGAVQHLFMVNSFWTGTLATTGGAVVSVFAWDCDSSSSYGLGAADGAVVASEMHGCDIVGIWHIHSTLTGGKLTNTEFKAVAHDFSGMTTLTPMKMDALTYCSYLANVPTKAPVTPTLFDGAQGVGFAPTTSGDWTTSPTTAQAGLDELAARRAGEVILAPAASARNVIQPTAATVTPLTVKGFAAQSADLQEWQTSAGTALARINAAGEFAFAKGSGANNFAAGLEAAHTLSSGSHNTAVGDFALRAGNGSGNTAFGRGAGYGTTGSDNTAIGYGALSAAGAASNCVAVGESALSSATVNNGTAVGYLSAYQVSTGVNVTAIGRESGSLVTTGAEGVFVGYAADLSSSTQRDGVIAIGTGAKVDQDNSAVIGRTGVTSPLLGLNTTTPRAQIDINARSATTIGAIVQGASAQSANLYEWRNSAGAVLSSINSAGVLSGSAIKESIIIAASDETTNLVAGTAKVTFRMPYAFTVTEVRASVGTVATGATLLTVDINEAGSSILSTPITIDASEFTSTTAATPPVISDSALADDAEITVDIDAIGNTTPGKGLKVYIIGHRA